MAVTYAKGFNCAAEIVPEVAYGTLATGTEKALRIVDETLTRQFPLLDSMVKRGTGAERLPTVKDTESASGMVKVEADYHNIHEILLHALGTYTAGPPKEYEPAADITASYSVVIDRGVTRFQYTGGMIEELRILGDAATSRIFLEADWIFQKGATSATALAGAALTSSTLMKMSELTFRIGTTADALASGDALALSSFVLRIKNNWKIDFASGSAYMIQPIRDTLREVTLSIMAPRYSSDDEIAAIMTAVTGDSVLQADFTWDGPDTDSLLIELPEMKTAAPPALNIQSHAVIPFSMDFNCFKNENNQTYMSDAADMDVRMELVNA